MRLVKFKRARQPYGDVYINPAAVASVFTNPDGMTAIVTLAPSKETPYSFAVEGDLEYVVNALTSTE